MAIQHDIQVKESAFSRFFIRRALKKKVQEFHQEGYQTISVEELSRFFYQYEWQEEAPKSLRQKLAAIKALHVNRYFDFIKLEATSLHVPELQEIDLSKLL